MKKCQQVWLQVVGPTKRKDTPKKTKAAWHTKQQTRKEKLHNKPDFPDLGNGQRITLRKGQLKLGAQVTWRVNGDRKTRLEWPKIRLNETWGQSLVGGEDPMVQGVPKNKLSHLLPKNFRKTCQQKQSHKETEKLENPWSTRLLKPSTQEMKQTELKSNSKQSAKAAASSARKNQQRLKTKREFTS